jgi:hypothetical protein
MTYPLYIFHNTLNDTTNITSYAPSYVTTSIFLAAFTLLRLAKSRFEQILDPDVKEKGKSALFVAIKLLKRMSLVNNDICAKSADFLLTMWMDQTFFKTSDLSSRCKLRVRNRLSMSVVFDSILVWIVTYGLHQHCTSTASYIIRRYDDSESAQGVRIR